MRRPRRQKLVNVVCRQRKGVLTMSELFSQSGIASNLDMDVGVIVPQLRYLGQEA